MSRLYPLNSADKSEDDDSCVISLDGFESDNELNVDKIGTLTGKNCDGQDDLAELSKETDFVNQKSDCKTRTIENHSKKGTERLDSTYSDVSTPPIDSKSYLPAPVGESGSIAKETSRIDVSYSPDFTEVSEQMEDKMTAWERWFVMKQRQIRLRNEMEQKKKSMEEQKVMELRKKKAEENERKQKLWLEKKKMEDIARKEKEKAIASKNNKGTHNEFNYERWCQKKLQEKQSRIQYNKEQEKYEELQKEIRKKKNEKAQMEWMNKAKQRPITPRITFGYVGDSVIAFHDSTSHPPPSYINPIPWQP